jgi:hypothetical protein
MGMITAEVREVKLISPQVDLSNIPSPKAFPWLSFNFADPQSVLAQVRQSAPSNGQDVVGWMQDAAALNAYAQVTEETYNSIGAMRSGAPLAAARPSCCQLQVTASYLASGYQTASTSSARTATRCRGRGTRWSAPPTASTRCQRAGTRS